jgi:hypothetical protein
MIEFPIINGPTYLVKIKKEYTSDVIEDLMQMEAIEL